MMTAVRFVRRSSHFKTKEVVRRAACGVLRPGRSGPGNSKDLLFLPTLRHQYPTPPVSLSIPGPGPAQAMAFIPRGRDYPTAEHRLT